eukprot:983799-Pleurochrysis_carterae.AAC.1
MDLRTEMRPNRGQNQVRLRLPMVTLSTRRGISTVLMLPRCDRSLQLRNLRSSRDGAYVYARLPKLAVRYPPRLETSASPSH